MLFSLKNTKAPVQTGHTTELTYEKYANQFLETNLNPCTFGEALEFAITLQYKG